MVFMFYAVVGIIVGVIDATLFSKAATVANFAGIMLSWEVIIGAGLMSTIGFLGHVFKSEKVAKYIGWESNYFQKELGFAELGMAIIAFMSFWKGKDFIYCTVIVVSVLCFGATYVHILDLKKRGNVKKGNAFQIVPDLFIPITMIVLTFISL